MADLGGVDPRWGAEGRLCAPRMLFVFTVDCLDVDEMTNEINRDHIKTREDTLM